MGTCPNRVKSRPATPAGSSTEVAFDPFPPPNIGFRVAIRTAFRAERAKPVQHIPAATGARQALR